MTIPVRKAVIPAAGLGTRFLPATKAMPKEMLTVVDKPAIQYVVEEAAAAGLNDMLIITGRNKNTLENHFDTVPEVEQSLRQKGDHARLTQVQHSTALADMHFVRQGAPRGLGHAVSRARNHVGQEPFAVLLGDDLIDERDELLSHMLAQHRLRNATIVALMQVPPEEIHLYGSAAVEPTDDPAVVRVTGLVEKAAADTAPSHYAVIGRYILQPQVFDVLADLPAGKNDEIQLTDALQRLAQTPTLGGGVFGVIFSGRRYDTGDRLGWIQANIRLAAEREDLGPGLRSWLAEFLNEGN